MPIADPGAGAATPAPPLSVDDQMGRLKDGDGIISPLTFPDPSVSVDYVNAMASGLRELGTSIADTGNDITGSWGGLNGPYSAPESETLFSVLDPVATDGDTVGEELGRAARALESFAEDVADIKTRWSNLRVEAYDLRSRIAAEGDDWDKGGGFAGFGKAPLVEENDALIEQGRKIVNDYTEVENTCANAINNGIAGRTNFEKQPEGDAELDPNVFYHGFDQDLSELAEAWGHESAQTDHGWWVDAGHAVWDFGVDAVEGVGAMVGAHSSQGWFEASWGDALKEYHWDNLTSAASLVGMYDAESDSLGWNGGEGVGQAWKDLAHSVVPWEEWGDRPGYVIGTAALNVIGLVGGAALTATGVGAVVGVPLMAWRGMSIVDGMGGSGSGGSGGGADIDLPDVSHVPQFGGSGSPLINLAGRALDTTGFGPARMADVQASIDRLISPGREGSDSGGGLVRPRPGQDPLGADGRATQRPVADPTVADALAFDDIVDHPGNQTFGDQVRATDQGAISEVDQKAKTNPSRTPSSEEGTWTAEALSGGPEGDHSRLLAGTGGRGGDTDIMTAERENSSSGSDRPADRVGNADHKNSSSTNNIDTESQNGDRYGADNSARDASPDQGPSNRGDNHAEPDSDRWDGRKSTGDPNVRYGDSFTIRLSDNTLESRSGNGGIGGTQGETNDRPSADSDDRKEEIRGDFDPEGGDSPQSEDFTSTEYEKREDLPVEIDDTGPTDLIGEVHKAIDLVSQVHGFPDGMRELTVKFEKLKGDTIGRYNDVSGTLSIDPGQRNIRETLVHEIGHAMDQAGDSNTRLGMATKVGARKPNMKNLLDSMRNSPEFESLGNLQNPKAKVYFRSDQELFARAYSQWITERTKDPVLTETINRLRSTGGFERARQWQDGSFKPIAQAMDKLFKEDWGLM
ncbi:hypothetical protein [Nocardiopsis listeri]|uniref:hypothetical protein n=1 Tax=Nocardiopsis listeri TaxID=53440 RepID=UPI0012ED47FF|nr:hypothetical protein [Nocardiopsis listeri]